jgi:cyclophilin family peptidyl-prolyl cis-trans isomerase
VSRKRRNKKAQDPKMQNPSPAPPAPAPGSPRYFALFATILFVVILGGGFAVWFLIRGQDSGPVVVIDTSMGTIKARLFQRDAPTTVENFLKYVDAKHYDGTIFHRVMPDFMVQGGGFEPGLREKGAGSPIKNESYNGVRNERGTLAMARTPRPDSATDQFFINLKDNAFLDQARAPDKVGYAVFGRVIEGMDVVDRIARVETADRGGHEKVPVEDVIIKSVRRADAD